MAELAIPKSVLHLQIIIDFEGLTTDYAGFFNENHDRDRHVQISKYGRKQMIMLNIAMEEFSWDAILNRVFIKKPDDQPIQVQFKLYSKSSQLKIVRIVDEDFWKYVVDGKFTVITEWKKIKYERQDISLQNLTLKHLMLNLSEKNVLEVLEIADIGDYKNLKTQCINLIQIHLDELKDTPKFASLKTDLKETIFNTKISYKDRRTYQLIQDFRFYSSKKNVTT